MRHKVTVRTSMGWAQALDDTPEVPPFERFYMGGNLLRGFSYRGAGPHIRGNPTGGEWLVLASAEYLYPLVKDLFGVVAFVDSGTLATTFDAPDSGLWRVSVGGGLRVKIPMLGPTPLALDFGFPLMYEEEDERTLVSFNLGRDF
jgi:outer membrane protein insertion porin family